MVARGNRTYTIWRAMRARCASIKHKAYKDYGGRGIRVCANWDRPGGFADFLAAMGPCPPGLTLERMDTDGGYNPDNCRWATWHEQHRNTSRNINLTLNGRTQCMRDWSIELGVPYQTLKYRVNHWGAERALTYQKKERTP